MILGYYAVYTTGVAVGHNPMSRHGTGSTRVGRSLQIGYCRLGDEA